MCSLWIVNYKHKFISKLIFFFNYWPFLYLFWMIWSTNYATWKGVYTHRNSICSLLQVVFIITCSFSMFVENCILLPMRYKWICCVPVYCTCMVLIFYPFTQILIISHKRDNFFPEQKFCFRVHFYFQVQKCSIEIFLSE